MVPAVPDVVPSIKPVEFDPKLSLSSSQQTAVQNVPDDWADHDKVSRLWNRDPSLWTSSREQNWLGWLNIVQEQLRDLGRMHDVAGEVQRNRFSDIVVLGMGGSSLCPDVLSRSFPRTNGYPPLHVLDSTVPAQVLALEKRINLEKTLFIVSSKSGSTLEPEVFRQYFFDRSGKNGHQFWAVTDPGSKLEEVAARDRFAKVFRGVPAIGGRFSALSDFGIIPAAAMGLDVFSLLDAARQMSDACAPWQPVAGNPGLVLGAALGTLALEGRDKLTIVCSPQIRGMGAWLEQLVAESTGKLGKGIIPVDLEPLSSPSVYAEDRVFAYLRLTSAPDASQDRALNALANAGHPIITISLENVYQLAAEFFRWEFATAVAGSLLNINPFDQPDVEASKVATRRLTQAFEQTGSLPTEEPALVEHGLALYGKAESPSIEDCLRKHFRSITPGDFVMGRYRTRGYIGLLAYIEMNPRHESLLQGMRERLRDATKAATCVGFGPRFLHSTGQAYKGGPESGVFLQITSDDAMDVAVPGQGYTFGVIKAAQAQGDLEVLRERGRRALRIHLKSEVGAGLAQLASLINRALQ